MEVLLANPDAIITFNVERFLSATQGQLMLTSNQPPDIRTDLVLNTTGRVARLKNNEFELSGGDPEGKHPITLHLVVVPRDEYAAVDLVIKRLTPSPEGGVAWDQLTIGKGNNDNVIVVRDHGRVPDPTQPITYEFYMLIKRRDAGGDHPFGDIGVIDPSWINR